MSKMNKEEYLRILKDFSIKESVNGSISNKMYYDLRRKFPWHFLMFSWKNKSEKAIETHKQFLIEQYKERIEVLLKTQLTINDVNELDLINELFEKICKRKEPIENNTRLDI